jgi:hypothetical protein
MAVANKRSPRVAVLPSPAPRSTEAYNTPPGAQGRRQIRLRHVVQRANGPYSIERAVAEGEAPQVAQGE